MIFGRTTMKFDYIVGNPPFQNYKAKGSNKKLWKDITVKMISLAKHQIFFITPDTWVQYLIKKYPNTVYIDYTADDYFDVGVKIVAWGISMAEAGDIKVVDKSGTRNLSGEGSVEWHERDSIRIRRVLENLKNTKVNIRLFKRQGCGNGDLVCIKNSNKNPITYDTCKEYIIPIDHNKMVISLSRALDKNNIIITKEPYGSLYAQMDLEKYTRDEIKNIIRFLLYKKFLKLCSIYKKIHNTGFNNVLLYLPDLDYHKNDPETNYKNLIKYLL
jgi:hypothetical protein